MHVGILCRRSLSVSALTFLFNPCSSSSYTTGIYYIYVVSITKRAHALTFKIAKYSFAGYFMLYFRQSKKNVTWFNLYKGLINIETKTTVSWNNQTCSKLTHVQQLNKNSWVFSKIVPYIKYISFWYTLYVHASVFIYTKYKWQN